jgi:gluconate 2-dehydrogenase gamma chain
LFFTVDEAKLVDALASRILPGTADDPGAHELGVVFYIDRVLAGPNLGYDYKTYQQGPFLMIDEQPTTVEASTSRDIYQYATVASANVSRYGFQSPQTPAEVYRRGLSSVDAYAQSKLKKNFVDLSSDDQDGILTDMAGGKATGFDDGGGKAFFTQLRNDTIEGSFSDPQYGGNRGMGGWKLVGFPGAQPYYSAADMANTNFQRDPQSLADMIAKMQS